MMELLLLKDILIVLALSMVVLYVCHRLKVPAVVGFLLTGIMAGPHGLGLITADKVHILAEIGVVMLLFTIGIEFSLKDLIRIKRAVLMGGSLHSHSSKAVPRSPPCATRAGPTPRPPSTAGGSTRSARWGTFSASTPPAGRCSGRRTSRP